MRSMFVAVAALLLGCVNNGDDTTEAAAPGALGGPCFSNNTCNSGLTCVLQNGKGICETSDATVNDAPQDQSVDAPGDAMKDAGSDADACGTTLAATEPCTSSCGDAAVCCAN